MSDIIFTPELISILIGALVLFIGLIFIVIKNSKKVKISQRINIEKNDVLINELLNEKKDSIVAKDNDKTWFQRKAQELEQANTKINMPIYILIMILAVSVIFIISINISKMFILSLVLSAFGLLLPEKIVNMQREKNIESFNVQFIKALKRISSVVRAGGTPKQGVIDVSTSRAIPLIVKLEFKKVLWDMEYGKTIEESLFKLFERTGSEDVRDISVIIEIHRKYGGNLPQILDLKAKSISTRKLMESGVKAKLANARMSAYILTGLFASLGLFLMVLSPHYFDPMLTNMGGRLILLFCIGLEITGVFVVSKMLKIKI